MARSSAATATTSSSALALDSTDRVYVAGSTNSSGQLRRGARRGPGSPAPSGTDVFVAKFNTARVGRREPGLRHAAQRRLHRRGRRHRGRQPGPGLGDVSQRVARADAGAATGLPAEEHALDTVGRATSRTRSSSRSTRPATTCCCRRSSAATAPAARHVAVAINADGEVWVGSSSGGDNDLARARDALRRRPTTAATPTSRCSASASRPTCRSRRPSTSPTRGHGAPRRDA